MFNGDRSAKYPNEQDMVHEGKLILTQWSSLWTFYFLKMRNFILQRALKKIVVFSKYIHCHLYGMTDSAFPRTNPAPNHTEKCWGANHINHNRDRLNAGQIIKCNVQGRYNPIEWHYHKHADFQECQQAAPVGIIVVVAAPRPTGAAKAGLEGLLIVGISAAAGAKISVVVPHGCLLYTVQFFWSMAHRQAATSGYTV